MRKTFISIILFLLIIIMTMNVNAQNIIEIEKPELKRSREELILKQFSFQIGEVYSKTELELSKIRLLNSDLFNPFTLEINSEKMDNDDYQIFINAEESGIFMIHPWEFTIRKTVGLLGESFEQKIRNPAGNGLSYLFDFDWSDDSYDQYFMIK
jgi:biopolymer transport protein ExbD